MGMLRETLRLLLRATKEEGTFRLSSGREATSFYNLRWLTSNPTSTLLIALLMARYCEGVGGVVGVHTGGVPIAAALSQHFGVPLYIWASGKLDGYPEIHHPLVLIEDVVTTGATVSGAIKELRPLATLAVLQRDDVEPNPKVEGRFVPLFRVSEL